MKPEPKKQQLSEEDLQQTAGGKIPLEGELSANELDKVSGGATTKRPFKVSVVETE
jgi:hypothetical protein